MSVNKHSFFHYVSGKSVLNILVLLIIFWVLSRPLKDIVLSSYKNIGLISNKALEGITITKSNLEQLVQSQGTIDQQSRTISSLKIKVNHLEDKINEAERLKVLSNLQKKIRYRTICADVIGRTADNWHKQIIINKGSQQNIMAGDSILTEKGVVGQVVETKKDTATVELISNPAFKLGGKIKNKDIIGILSGKTNSVGLFEFIPVGTPVMVGDLIVTSGISPQKLTPTYPSGHPLGKISKISRKKSKSSDLYIEVKLFEDLNSLNNIIVFLPEE